MPKIDVSKVAEIIQHNHVAPDVLRRIIEEINQAVQPDPDAEEKPAPAKKQFVIIVSDPEGKLPKDDFTGWVVQIEENESPATTLDRVHRAAYDFNATKRGRLLPVKTIGEAIENVPARHCKEAGLFIKTKTPVFLIRTTNLIPQDDANHIDHRKSEEPVAEAK